MNTLIDRIEAAMQDDDEDREDQSRRLLDLYENSSPEQRQAIDDALICICGWALKNVP